jgi:CheY-like chemotaxis protein
MPEGGTIRVDTRRRRLTEEDRLLHPWVEPGEYACLTVTDNGQGMDQRTLDRIFEPFFTTKPRGEGTGLGMAMVYGLVKQHAGYIHVYSEEGCGTVVRIYFPVAREHATMGEDEAPATVELPRGTETILLVEDDCQLLRAARRLLGKRGYRMLVATDGVQALETLRAHEGEIALVVSDMVLPRMGGRQLFGTLRAEGKTVPVLLTSGYSAGAVGELVDAYGTVPFLAKPWTVEELLLKVRQVLDDATATRSVCHPWRAERDDHT